MNDTKLPAVAAGLGMGKSQPSPCQLGLQACLGSFQPVPVPKADLPPQFAKRGTRSHACYSMFDRTNPAYNHC